jgi:hypothetical protein
MVSLIILYVQICSNLSLPVGLDRDIEERRRQKTEVLYGTENAIYRGIQFMRNVRKKMDICFDHSGASIVTEIDEYKSGYIDIMNRGAKTRAITEITKDNIEYCKKLMEIVDELRHLDDLKGGLAVNETEYMATTVLQEAKPLTQVIYSNVQELVEQQQYFYNTIWSKAIPAKRRIREIEEGLKREFIETIQCPYEAQKLIFDTIKSATEEIEIIFSTSNTLYRYEHEAILLELLKEKVTTSSIKHNIKIRILVPDNNSIKRGKLQQLLTKGQGQGVEQGQQENIINIKYLRNSSLQGHKLTTLIVDNQFAITAELNDYATDSSHEAIGLTTYSNSEATILSYASIFETLWIQAELDENQKSTNNFN